MHMVTGMKTPFSGVVGGSETWGMPLQMDDIYLTQDGDTLHMAAGRNGVDFMSLDTRLEHIVLPSPPKGPNVPRSSVDDGRRRILRPRPSIAIKGC